MRYSRTACLAWLASGGLSPADLTAVLEEEPDPVRLWEGCVSGGGMDLFPDSGRLRALLRKNSAEKYMDAWESLMERDGIRAMTMGDEAYPERLRPLPDAPALLFYQGDPGTLREGRTVSVVGSRSASARGLEATRKMTEALSEAGVRIISGLAYGIDAAAHTGCLKGGSPTVAVLGCGLDQNYPAENEPLRRSILAHGGAVISEYAPGEKPLGWHFPVRNRIISGLGDCLVLMEARIRSGSMTTVQHALNQGKDVFVYPGDPESVKYEGNRQLLREGAIYFTSAGDLMEDMRWLDKTRVVGQNSGGEEAEEPDLSPEEKKIWKAVEGEEQGFDELCARTGLSPAQLNATLSMLQIQGLVEALPGKRYRRTAN